MLNLMAYGLRISSAFDLPGAPQLPFSEAAELSIRIGETASHPAIEEVIGSLGPYVLSRSSLLFRAPLVADYKLTRDGRSIEIEPAPGAADEAVSELLIATALPAALWMRDEIVLHASAAVLPATEGALAFGGASGVGKSRLLARLVESGSSVVAEDSLCLRTVEGHSLASGLPGCLFLRAPGADEQQARQRVVVSAARQRVSAPLRALIMLTPDGPGEPQRLEGTHALQALLDSLHRPRVPRLLGLLPALLPRLAMLVDQLPVYRWRPAYETGDLPLLQRFIMKLPAGP